MTDSERALFFGDDGEANDRFRRGYPESIEKAMATDPRLGIIEHVTDVFYGYR